MSSVSKWLIPAYEYACSSANENGQALFSCEYVKALLERVSSAESLLSETLQENDETSCGWRNMTNEASKEPKRYVFNDPTDRQAMSTITDAVLIQNPALDALQGLMSLIEDGVLVRDISHDAESGWAMKQIHMMRILATANDLLGKKEPISNREAHEEAAGMGRAPEFFAASGIDPNAPYAGSVGSMPKRRRNS